MHRIISDLSAFIGRTDPGTHRILAAGDLNMEFSRANEKSPWLRRERTIIDRMDALGLEMLGPQYPNGRKADTTPERLPPDTRNVPTYRYLKEPLETITWQLDWPSRPAASTKTSSCAPSTKSKNGDQATTAVYSSKLAAAKSLPHPTYPSHAYHAQRGHEQDGLGRGEDACSPCQRRRRTVMA